jgi:hypothetical protein
MGRETSAGGGVLAAADVRGGGDMEWAQLTGIKPGHPLISPHENRNENRMVTTPAGQSGPAGTGGVMATPDGAIPGLNQLDDWRDLFNFKGSPMPWLLLIALGILFFAQASIKARAGAFGRSASASAALG